MVAEFESSVELVGSAFASVAAASAEASSAACADSVPRHDEPVPYPQIRGFEVLGKTVQASRDQRSSLLG